MIPPSAEATRGGGSARRRLVGVAALTAGLAGLALFAAAPAFALPQSPQWTVTSVSTPTNFAPNDQNGDDLYKVTVINTGGAASDGTTVTVTDALPPGLALDPAGASGEELLHHEPLSCAGLACTYSGTVVPDDTLTVTFPVDVSASPPPSCEVPATATSCVANLVSVSGGGAPDASMRTPTAISSVPTEFGLAPGGETTALSTNQAGAHADITISQAFGTTSAKGDVAGDPKKATYDLPPGFAGDVVDTPFCPVALFSREECSIGTQVGIATLAVSLGGTTLVAHRPVYNLIPDSGQISKIGFYADTFHIQGDVSLRPGDYGLRTAFRNLYSGGGSAQLDSTTFTIWGVPADPLHDPLRWNPASGEFGASSDAGPAPYFTNPTSCTGEPLQADLSVDSWQRPAQAETAQMPLGTLVDCERLGIEPSLSAQPTTTAASSPSGLDVDLKIPQTYEDPYALATSNLKTAAFSLPEGMTLNPSAAAGLGACTETEYAAETLEPAPGEGCPEESKVGSVRIQSASVSGEATGSLFIAKPYENPFDSLLAVYLVARVPDRGVVVKIAGRVQPDALTGRLLTTFEDNPQLPFSDLDLSFRQGQTAPFVTPDACGSFTTQAEITPWSDPSMVEHPSASFQITRGANGGPCPAAGQPPFHPRVSSGTLSNQAGQYSPYYLDITRADGETEVTHFAAHFPPGLVAKLAGVPFCSDAAIEAAKTRSGAEEEEHPSCPEASEIGHTEVGAGVGSILTWAPGKVYLAGPYRGSGVSAVAITAAKVGPFDLGTVVVRAVLHVDPETGRATVESSGSDAIPHIIDGIPLRVRDIQVRIDRPQFSLNPTSCDPFSFLFEMTGAGTESEGGELQATVADPFQVTNCAILPFTPRLGLQLSGGARRGANPALSVTLTASPGEANIARAETLLPRSEFVENAHLHSICTRVQFAAGACPAESIYGYARAETPLLSEPVEGPVYLRSSNHELPDIVVALQNREVGVYLDGHVDSVNGRIRATFEALPDVPLSNFTLSLGGGAKGLFVNSTNLCKSTNRAVVRLTGQNGKTMVSSPPFVPSSCAKHRRKHQRMHRRP